MLECCRTMRCYWTICQIQPRLQSIVIVGAEKTFRGHRHIFLRFGSKDQKKVFIPSCASFRGKILAREGHVHSLAGRDRVLWCGFRLLPTNPGVKTKKKKKNGLPSEILDVVLGFTCVYCRGTRLYLRLGGTSNILKEHGS